MGDVCRGCGEDYGDCTCEPPKIDDTCFRCGSTSCKMPGRVKELEGEVKELKSIVGGDYKTYGLFYDMEVMKKEFEDLKRKRE